MRQLFLVIPTNHGCVRLKYKQEENGDWVSIICSETMNDLCGYIATGHYKLDPTKDLEISKV